MNRAQIATPVSAIEFLPDGHYFTAAATDTELDGIIHTIERPLSVIYQVTRRCNFDCAFCSETARVKDPTLEEIARIQRNLRGVQRVFPSGGEPLLRKDFMEIVSIFKEHIIGVPTNATRDHAPADQLAGRVAFVNIGLEGPRSTTNRVRGDYDKVMRGVDRFRSGPG